MRKNLINKAKMLEKVRKESPFKELETKDLGIKKKIQTLLNKAYMAYHQRAEKHKNVSISLIEEDRICAEVANESYADKGSRRKEILGYQLDENLSNADTAIYIQKEQKICVLGYRGTLWTDLKDLSSDAQIMLDIQGLDPRVKASLKIYDNCKRQYQGYALRVCGHSLGGTLSYIVAKHRCANKCVTFNPGVSLNTFFFQMIEDTIKKSDRTKNTRTYKILGDIISTAAFVGKTKTFNIKGNDPIKLHTMNNFIKQQ